MDSSILPAGLMLLLAALPISADILHVDASVSGGAGNGSSWSNAYADLQQALSAASPGDTIQLVLEKIGKNC